MNARAWAELYTLLIKGACGRETSQLPPTHTAILLFRTKDYLFILAHSFFTTYSFIQKYKFPIEIHSLLVLLFHMKAFSLIHNMTRQHRHKN